MMKLSGQMTVGKDSSNLIVQNCTVCKYMKMYDYGRKIYYCDHENRINDMGKLGADVLPEACPEWCPLKWGYGTADSWPKIRPPDLVIEIF